MKKVIYKKQTNEMEVVYSTELNDRSILGYINPYGQKGFVGYDPTVGKYENNGQYYPAYIDYNGRCYLWSNKWYDTAYRAASSDGRCEVFVFNNAKELQEWLLK